MSKKYICVTGAVILCALLAYGLLSYLFTPIYTDVSLSYPAICCRGGAGFEPVTVTFEGQIKDVRATGSSRFIGELTVGSRTAVYEDVDTGLALDLIGQTRLPLVFSDEPAASDATHLLQWGRPLLCGHRGNGRPARRLRHPRFRGRDLCPCLLPEGGAGAAPAADQQRVLLRQLSAALFGGTDFRQSKIKQGTPPHSGGVPCLLYFIRRAGIWR